MTSVSEPYARRESRAGRLLAAYPHAAEMLAFYRGVVARQKPLFDWILGGDVLADDAPPPSLGLERLPFAELSEPFRTFVGELAGAVPAALAAAARALAAPDAPREALLRHAATQDSLSAEATALACEVPHLAFFARAFLQPIAEGLAARDPRPADGSPPVCRRCGWPPQVAVLRDEPEIKGRRYLVCGLCATWWTFPRTTCASCGEKDPQKLPLHESESTPHLRIEECATCKAYLKSVDLRRDGFAVPEVDEIASIELDLWCEERGLWKISRNLLGM